MTQHTPGPWIVHRSNRENRYAGFHNDGRPYGDTGIEILAKIPDDGPNHGGYWTVVGHKNSQPWERILSEPDAILIAAAPSLLAALVESERCIVDLCDTINILHKQTGGNGRKVRADDYADKAREAIKQANGR